MKRRKKQRAKKQKRILDACCGSRMFWFDKENPDVVFADNRELHTTLVSTGIVGNFQRQVRLAEKTIKHSKGTVDPDRIYNAYDEFQKELRVLYPDFPVTRCFVDNEAQVIENGLRSFSKQKGYGTQVADCKKVNFTDRTLSYNYLFNTGKFLVVSSMCPMVVESLCTMVYADEKEDALLDDYTTDVDTYDADFYSWSRYIDVFYQKAKYKK